MKSEKNYQFIKFSLNKQKLDLERTMGVLGKPCSKKPDKKLLKKKITVRMPQVINKPLERKRNLVQTKN